jgi:hypothetical protein
LGCGVGTTADEAGGARPAHGGGGCCSGKRWIKSGEGSLTTRRRAGEGLGGGDGAAEEIGRRPSFGRRWIPGVAARVEVGRGREARVSEKSSRRAIGCAFIGQGGEEGRWPRATAINGYGGGRSSMYSRGGA